MVIFTERYYHADNMTDMGETKPVGFGEIIPNVEHQSLEAFYLYAQEVEFQLDAAALYLEREYLIELAGQFLVELSDLWPYPGSNICIKGKARMPDMSNFADGGSDSGEDPDFMASSIAMLDRPSNGGIYGEVNAVTGEHRGVCIHKVKDDEGKPGFRVRHAVAFAQGRYVTNNGTEEHEVTFLGYFELDSEVIPLDTFEEPDDTEIDIRTVPKRMIEHSNTLARLLNSTDFRRLTRRRQERQFYDLIESMQEDLPVRGRPVRISFKEDDRVRAKRQKTIPLPYIYVPYGDAEKEFYRKSVLSSEIGGICMGVASIDLASVKERAIRQDADLRDKRAGLCLVIDPDLSTMVALGEASDGLIYVPVSAQKIEAKFS